MRRARWVLRMGVLLVSIVAASAALSEDADDLAERRGVALLAALERSGPHTGRRLLGSYLGGRRIGRWEVEVEATDAPAGYRVRLTVLTQLGPLGEQRREETLELDAQLRPRSGSGTESARLGRRRQLERYRITRDGQRYRFRVVRENNGQAAGGRMGDVPVSAARLPAELLEFGFPRLLLQLVEGQPARVTTFASKDGAVATATFTRGAPVARTVHGLARQLVPVVVMTVHASGKTRKVELFLDPTRKALVEVRLSDSPLVLYALTPPRRGAAPAAPGSTPRATVMAFFRALAREDRLALAATLDAREVIWGRVQRSEQGKTMTRARFETAWPNQADALTDQLVQGLIDQSRRSPHFEDGDEARLQAAVGPVRRDGADHVVWVKPSATLRIEFVVIERKDGWRITAIALLRAARPGR